MARININLSDDAYGALKQAAQESGIDMSQFVRNSLQIYKYLQNEKQKGKQVFVGGNDKAEKEVILP
jgi:hypothetical protein